MTPPRVFFYVQHLLGIGHLARASRIATALVEDGFDVTVVTGGTPVAGFPDPAVKTVALPPVTSGDAGFLGAWRMWTATRSTTRSRKSGC